MYRTYNTATGEQSNVLVEDMMTRPWHERDYIRVDWGSNVLEGGVDFGGLFSGIATASYYDRDHDPYDPDRLRLEDDFIFFTNNYVVYDGGYSCLSGFGSPSGAGGYGNCGSVEVKVRNAFARIDNEDAAQFEPREYIDEERILGSDGEPLRYIKASVNGDSVDLECTPEVLERLGPAYSENDCQLLTWRQMGRFGFFRSTRYAYDRRVGGAHDVARQIRRHHQTGRARNEMVNVSRSLMHLIVCYLNPNFPDDLEEVTRA